MKLKLLSWNVRGLNDPKKREVLKNWLWKWKVDVVCLQETKLDRVDWRLIQSIWGNRLLVGQCLTLLIQLVGSCFYGIKGCWK
jgi:hypothetical protein